MTATPQRRFVHLTLVELLIGILVLGVAGFFVVRGMQQAKESAQRAELVEALEEWETASLQWEQQTKIAESIFALLKANPKFHNTKCFYGSMPLHVASCHGNRDIAQKLIDHGANINAKGSGGLTPLHWAVAIGHKDVSELLLANGANVNAKDNDGLTPLHWVARYGYEEDAKLKLIRDAYLAVNITSLRAPLRLVAPREDKGIVELLLAKGSDVNAKDKGGSTPLDMALAERNDEILDLLRQHGAKEADSPPVAPATEK